MEITYSLTKEDLIRYQAFLIRRTPSLRFRQISGYLFLPLVCVLLVMGPLTPVQNHSLGLIYTVLFALIWIPFMMWTTKRAVLKRNANVPGLFDPHTVQINETNFHSTSSHTQITYAWQSFTEITDNSSDIFLLMNPTYGIIIPKNAFLNPEDANAFLKAAKGFWQSAVFGGDAPTVPESSSWPPSPRRGV